MNLRHTCLLVSLAPGALMALELPGIFAPSPLADGSGLVTWNNDAFGPAGGSRSDDFRTNGVGVGLAWGPVLIGIDHSILTTSNPTEAPVYWGYPDPGFYAREGAQRVDEGVLTAGLRRERGWGPITAWGQLGGGVLVTGDLLGEEIQNGVHAVIQQASFAMPYERTSLRWIPLGYAGAGGQLALGGPGALWLGSLGSATVDGASRWQHEALLAATGAGGGMWGGARIDGAGGEAPTQTAAKVADQETGLSVVSGLGIRVSSWALRVESQRNLRTDAQVGRVAVVWQDAGAGRVGAGGIGWGRVGLLPMESRVKGRGLDYAFGWDVGPVLVMVGLRDNEMSSHYVMDMQGRRHLLWAGVGQAPILARTGPVTWQGWWETGLGWRHSVVSSHGFLTLDDQTTYGVDAAIARAAVGLGPRLTLGPAADVGVLVLGEGVLASRTASTEIAVHDPNTFSVIRRREDYPVEGSAFGLILSSVVRWGF